MVLSDDPRVSRQLAAMRAAGYLTVLVTSDRAKVAAALPTAGVLGEVDGRLLSTAGVPGDDGRRAGPLKEVGPEGGAHPQQGGWPRGESAAANASDGALSLAADVVLSWDSLRLGEYSVGLHRLVGDIHTSEQRNATQTNGLLWNTL